MNPNSPGTLPPSRGAGTNQSNFAGTKTWAGGSSQIGDFAGKCTYNKFADSGTSGTSGRTSPGRHPEGVKGGNSDFPNESY